MLDNLNRKMSEADMNATVERMMNRLEEVNNLYVSKVASQIKKIGELNQSSINRLTVMAEMGADVAEITHRLQLATGLNSKEIFNVYQQALNDVYTDQRFSRYLEFNLGINPPQSGELDRIQQYAQNISTQTARTMMNLSNTTAISQPYQEAVDKAILAVSTGVGDYKSATRETVRKLGYNGLQVQYESGYHRRLDTAVRQNIIDGANQIAQNASIMMGEALGYDAIELSAHLRSAPDHEPVQGRVFLKAEFEKMQIGADFVDVDGRQYKGFRRPIGEWNCMHIAMAFSTQHSIRRYTEEQLAAWAKSNAEGCEIDGKHCTTYQAVQLMRQIETEVRRQKDVAVVAQQVGDDALRRDCQKRIDALARRYSVVANTAGITPRKDRMAVEGFRAIKVK